MSGPRRYTAAAAIISGFLAPHAPAIANADDSIALGTQIIRDACLPTSPTFVGAIDRAMAMGLVDQRADNTALNSALEVSMTVQPAQSIFGIPIEPLCLVGILNRDGAEAYEAAGKLAIQMSPDAYQSGDVDSIPDDELDWTFDHNGVETMLSLQEDSLLFTKYAILSLTTFKE